MRTAGTRCPSFRPIWRTVTRRRSERKRWIFLCLRVELGRTWRMWTSKAKSQTCSQDQTNNRSPSTPGSALPRRSRRPGRTSFKLMLLCKLALGGVCSPAHASRADRCRPSLSPHLPFRVPPDELDSVPWQLAIARQRPP